MTVVVQKQNDVVILADSKKNYVAALKGTVIINNSNGTGNSTVNLSFNETNGFTGNFTNGNLTINLQNANATQSGKLTSTDWQRLDGVVGNVTLAQSNITALQNETASINSTVNLTSGNVTALQNLTASINQTLSNHTGNFTNPHNVTKSQIGLGNVSDIAPLDLPISNATQTALNAKLDASQKGATNGVAELVNGTVPISQLPSYVDDVVESANFAALPVTGEAGKIYVTLDDNLTYRWSGSAYVEISKSLALGETSATAYRGDRGAIAYNHSQTTHDKAFVGLGNVDNTSDLDKPISNATQSALNTKANANLTINGQSLTGNVTLTTANISDSTDKRYVNESQLANINNITTNHSALSNINWINSGHTGNASTVAGFASDGAAQYLTTNGSGSVVLTSNAALTNANLTTPILGTPQSGNLTNCNGTAQNLTAGNVSYLNLSANTTNISGTLGLSNGGTNSNLTALTLKLQEVSNISSAYTNTTASIPYDNTKPQSSEGTLILTKTITPKSVNSTLKISTQLWVAANEAARIIGAVFSNVTGADALSSGHTFITSTSTEAVFPLPIQAIHTPNTTNPVNISVRVGSPTSKTVSVNGATSGAVLGGSLQSSLIILEEIDVT